MIDLTYISPLICIIILLIFYYFILLFKFTKVEESVDNIISSLNNQYNESNKDVYSEKIFNFTDTMINKISILKYSSFIDGHYTDMITKANIEKLASDVATEVYNSIDIDKINFNNTLFTKEFYEKYIIETSLTTIKRLIEKTINND